MKTTMQVGILLLAGGLTLLLMPARAHAGDVAASLAPGAAVTVLHQDRREAG